MKLLVVEDERKMADVLRKGLEEEGYAVTVARDGTTGLSYAQSGGFDGIVLDVMLEGLNGFDLARRLRHERNQTPILFLTAKDSIQDVVEGLNLGGDDYLTKPFSFEILLARLRALTRRGPAAQPVRLQVADLVLDLGTREVRRGNDRITLTKKEFSLLETLMRRPGHVVDRESLISAVWGFERDIESNTLDAFIRLLRGKVDQGRTPKLIQTIRGVGYCVRPEAEG
jgi:DNA-binding response OmpR family regulator